MELKKHRLYAELTLTIGNKCGEAGFNKSEYNLTEVDVRSCETRCFKLQRLDARFVTYQIHLWPHGYQSCTCPKFRYTPVDDTLGDPCGRAPCKHLLALRQCGFLPGPVPTPCRPPAPETETIPPELISTVEIP